MNKGIKYVVITVIFIARIAAAVFGYDYLSEKYSGEDAAATPPAGEDASPAPEETKTPATDFTVLDMEGNSVSLSDFEGQPVVINFWATWCGPCRTEMGLFDQAYKEYGEDVEFMMVNLTDGARDTVDKVSSFISENGYSFPVYCDTELTAANAYSVYSIPTTLVVDSEGNLLASYKGIIPEKTLYKYIDEVLEGVK